MKTRNLFIPGVIFCAIVIAALCVIGMHREAPARSHTIQTSNPLIAKPNMVDRLDFFDTPASFDRATLQHVTLATTQPAQIVLSDQRPKSFPRSGTWNSDVMETAFPFTELIPSWNAAVPRDT